MKKENITKDKLITLIIFLIALLGITLSFIRSINEKNPLDMIAFFTNQSNILVTLILGLYFTKVKDKPIYKYLALIGLVDILMTGIIYHLIVNGPSQFLKVDFNGHLVHTATPILYPIFYYLFIKGEIPFKKIWVSLMHPLAYFLYFILLGPIIKWYPYNFLNPTLENSSLGSVLFFCLIILLPIIFIFSIGLIYLKNTIEKRKTA